MHEKSLCDVEVNSLPSLNGASDKLDVLESRILKVMQIHHDVNGDGLVISLHNFLSDSYFERMMI